jgi:ketopantoate reductase
MTARTTGRGIEITRIADANYTLAYDQKPPADFPAIESLIAKMDVVPSRGQVKLGVKTNILQAEFDKILINAASNGPNTIFGFLRQKWKLRELADDAEATKLARGILLEVIEVGRAFGLMFDPAVIEQVIGRWRGDSAEHTTSMAQQFRRDRTASLEIDPIYDRVAALGRKVGIATPHITETATMLRHLTHPQEPDPRCIVTSISSLAKRDNCLGLRASETCQR